MSTTQPAAALKLPAWIGFLVLVLGGAAVTVVGIAGVAGADVPGPPARWLVGGIACLVIGLFSWIVGGSSAVRQVKVGSEWKFLVSVGDLPWWAWVVDIVVAVAALVLTVVL